MAGLFVKSIRSLHQFSALIKEVYASSLSEDSSPVGTSESRAFKPNVTNFQHGSIRDITMFDYASEKVPPDGF